VRWPDFICISAHYKYVVNDDDDDDRMYYTRLGFPSSRLRLWATRSRPEISALRSSWTSLQVDKLGN